MACSRSEHPSYFVLALWATADSEAAAGRTRRVPRGRPPESLSGPGHDLSAGEACACTHAGGQGDVEDQNAEDDPVGRLPLMGRAGAGPLLTFRHTHIFLAHGGLTNRASAGVAVSVVARGGRREATYRTANGPSSPTWG